MGEMLNRGSVPPVAGLETDTRDFFCENLKTPFLSVFSTGLRHDEVASATQAGTRPYTTGLFDGPLEMAKQLPILEIGSILSRNARIPLENS